MSSSLITGPFLLPIPGQYHPDAVVSLEFEAAKRQGSSRPAGAFLFSSGRFKYDKGLSSPMRPGVPGAHVAAGPLTADRSRVYR
jgi:hypothetical protein